MLVREWEGGEDIRPELEKTKNVGEMMSLREQVCLLL
jgi:hypothetical protein